VDGRSHQAGFTTVFPPNAVVKPSWAVDADNNRYDVDWSNMQEGKSTTVKTFAAVTSRSYHPGVVVVSMMDGSTRAMTNSVDLQVWRAASTREGEESGDRLP